MANELGTVKIVLDGFVGGPGLIQLRFQGGTPGLFSNTDATAAIAAVGTWVTAIKSVWQAGLLASINSEVEVIDWTTGALVAITHGTGYAPVTSSGSATALAVEGPLVQWITSTVVGHRMLRGRTFLVPSCSAAMQAGGTVAAAMVTTLESASNALAATAAVTLSVWHRPDPTGLVPIGTCGAVVSANVPAKVSVLRSRRD